MLHEYRELIAELRQNDNHFARLFDEHNSLDEEIKRMESDAAVVANSQADIDRKKREKLALKDKIYDYLRKNSREKVDSYRRHGLRAGVNKRFESGIDATFQAIWRKTAYQDYHAWLETRRRDFERTYQLDIKFDRPFLRGFVPVLTVKHTDNKSSSWLNRYKRNEYMFKVEYGF